MDKIKKAIRNKDDFNAVYSLYSKQAWLIDKEDSLLELLNLSENQEEKKLIFTLLNEFRYIDHRVLSTYLNAIADFIITDSTFSENTSQIAALAYDSDADSSQHILQSLKMPLFQRGWSAPTLVNMFGKAIKHYNKGVKQIIFIDEFIGSGKTVISRIEYFNKNTNGDAELKFCFVAGMEWAINKIEELGYEVFCPLRLQRGITDFFSGTDYVMAVRLMLRLELRLAKEINDFNLEDYSFGYNNAQALYSMEGCQGNTPNSVFPIFWWPKDKVNSNRTTVLTRFERGLK